MRVRRRLLFTLAATLSAFVASAPAAVAATESASNGPLTAQMIYIPAGLGFKNLRIAIVRNGVTLVDHKPRRVCEFCGPVWPGGGGESPSVFALQLDSNPEPEAVFDLYSGGAHCCWYSLIYRYDPGANAYVGLVHHWFNAGYRFFDPEKDGIREFLSRNDRFAYKYASYAGSRYPPQIWRYVAGKMIDVTRRYRGIVRRSARGHLRHYKKERGKSDVRAALAAYAADKCLLRKCRAGFEVVRSARRQGYLAKRLTEFGPSGARFVRNLRSFLRRLDYL